MRVGHRSIAIHQLEDGPGHECAEDCFEPEPLGQDDEADQQHESAPDADLRSRVLQAEQCSRESPRALRTDDDEADRHRQGGEGAEQAQLRAEPR